MLTLTLHVHRWFEFIKVGFHVSVWADIRRHTASGRQRRRRVSGNRTVLIAHIRPHRHFLSKLLTILTRILPVTR